MKKVILGSFLYNLSYAAFLFGLLGYIYSLTDISELAFDVVLLYMNDYLIFKTYYSIAISILCLVAYFVQNDKLIKAVGYLQIWLIPLGPFLMYLLVKGLSEENKEKALRVLFLSVSAFLVYMGFFMILGFIALMLYGVLESAPEILIIVVYFIGIYGIYSFIGGILGLLTGGIKRLLRKLKKITSFVLVPLIPFGTIVWLVSREI